MSFKRVLGHWLAKFISCNFLIQVISHIRIGGGGSGEAKNIIKVVCKFLQESTSLITTKVCGGAHGGAPLFNGMECCITLHSKLGLELFIS